MMSRVALARYALVSGNVAREPVPVEIVSRWLEYIGGVREWEPCAGCMARHLANCHWACLDSRAEGGEP